MPLTFSELYNALIEALITFAIAQHSVIPTQNALSLRPPHNIRLFLFLLLHLRFAPIAPSYGQHPARCRPRCPQESQAPLALFPGRKPPHHLLRDSLLPSLPPSRRRRALPPQPRRRLRAVQHHSAGFATPGHRMAPNAFRRFHTGQARERPRPGPYARA